MLDRIVVIFISVLFFSCAQSQETENYRLLGGPCEGCEAVMEFGKNKLNAIDTLPGFDKAENKLMLTGIIYQPDGKSPAKNIVLYIHHTNAEGIYPKKGNEKGWAKRHGYLRGWIKTGRDGRYTFYTQVPGSYPNSSAPKHIHPLILEPDGRYYYMADFLFKDDPNLSEEHISRSPRGGDGVLSLQQQNGMATASRDLILGKNVPEY